jgi:hypothetical protein
MDLQAQFPFTYEVPHPIDETTASKSIWQIVSLRSGRLTQRTGVPQAVVDRSDGPTVLGMAQLNQEQGGTHLG